MPSHSPRPAQRHGAGDVGGDLRARLAKALGVARHDGDVDGAPAGLAVAAASRRDSTRSPRCRIAGTSSAASPAQPPACMRGALAKAKAGTIGAGRADHATGVQDVGESLPAPPSAPDRRWRSARG